ncbi:S8 family serine peptidase [Cyanobacteria bacterium FACHB-63]|nr:S8 family serine peptidase [Cyanobacteria bacterium FACHB-63]
MNSRQLLTPWSTRSRLYSIPGSLILKLTLGEAPEAIPTALDIRSGTQTSTTRTTIGSVDRIMRQFSDQNRIARVYTAAASLGKPGQQHQGFDDIEHVTGLSRTFRIQTDPNVCITDLIDALRQLSVVEQASPQYLSVLPFQSTPTITSQAPDDLDSAWLSRNQIRAAEAMGYEPGDPAVIIAIVDTGVETIHPELQGHLRSGVDTVHLTAHDLATGIQLVGDRAVIDTDTDDLVGHGTSCAGIIGARGEHLPPGLASGCELMPMRVLGAAKFPGKKDLVGIGAIADINLGMKYAIDLGAKVINMSFGTPEAAIDNADPLPHADIVRYGLARGCIMIAASGNSGKQERYLPAALPGVIAVGAVDASGKPTSFSTTGDHVALCAPGEGIPSAGLQGYSRVTGTSFAAPFVTAAAALLVSRAARRAYPLDSMTVRRILMDSAQAWSSTVAEGNGKGILDAYAALQRLDREIDQAGYSGLSPPEIAAFSPSSQSTREPT